MKKRSTAIEVEFEPVKLEEVQAGDYIRIHYVHAFRSESQELVVEKIELVPHPNAVQYNFYGKHVGFWFGAIKQKHKRGMQTFPNRINRVERKVESESTKLIPTLF